MLRREGGNGSERRERGRSADVAPGARVEAGGRPRPPLRRRLGRPQPDPHLRPHRQALRLPARDRARDVDEGPLPGRAGGTLPDAFTVDVEFRKPILLPARVAFTRSRRATAELRRSRRRVGRPPSRGHGVVSVADRSMGLGLRALGRLAGLEVVDRLGLREPAERAALPRQPQRLPRRERRRAARSAAATKLASPARPATRPATRPLRPRPRRRAADAARGVRRLRRRRAAPGRAGRRRRVRRAGRAARPERRAGPDDARRARGARRRRQRALGGHRRAGRRGARPRRHGPRGRGRSRPAR